MILITHDRFFLEKACNEILELDRASIYRYPGNYQRYLVLKEERLNAEVPFATHSKSNSLRWKVEKS